MNSSLIFIRCFYLLLSILLMTAYSTTFLTDGFTWFNALIGVGMGLMVGAILIASEMWFRKFNLRTFNIALLGLFVGYLMGQGIFLVLNTIVDFDALHLSPATQNFLKVTIYLFTTYISMILTLRAAEEFYVSIPFVRFKPTNQKKKDILIDSSILLDSRIIDLAASGLLDNHLVLPRFIIKDLQTACESGDEEYKSKARRSLEVLKKLEGIPHLDLRFMDTDYPDTKDHLTKLVKLARMIDCYILTADVSKIQQSTLDGVRFININMLGLKPIAQAGEYINIKIQRYGKEARQGVGYLEDGTMVVVNGGAEFIGDTIKALVLSVKHTSSGRMIFCNALDENDQPHDLMQLPSDMQTVHKNYFSV